MLTAKQRELLLVHRRPPQRRADQPELRRDARSARPQVQVGRAPADLGARGARLHPPPAQPGAGARGGEAAGNAAFGHASRRFGPSLRRRPTTRWRFRCMAGSPPARRSRRCRERRASPFRPRCSARASIMRSRSRAIRWSRKAFSTAISRSSARSTRARDGEIVVALIDNEEATLKTFRREGQHDPARSRQPRYEPQRYDEGRVQIQGRLAGLIRRY